MRNYIRSSFRRPYYAKINLLMFSINMCLLLIWLLHFSESVCQNKQFWKSVYYGH